MSVEIEFGTLCHAQIICYTFFCSRDIFGFARKLRYCRSVWRSSKVVCTLMIIQHQGLQYFFRKTFFYLFEYFFTIQCESEIVLKVFVHHQNLWNNYSIASNDINHTIIWGWANSKALIWFVCRPVYAVNSWSAT